MIAGAARAVRFGTADEIANRPWCFSPDEQQPTSRERELSVDCGFAQV